jgi:tetratricopeptide (TPR) repeat protein
MDRGATVDESAVIRREQELAALRMQALRADAGHGGAVLLEGLAGMGKSTLVESFRQSLSSSNDGLVATVASGYCYEVSGSNDAYEPFKEILRSLTEPSKRPDFSTIVLELIRRTGPDLLALIPGLGTASALAKIGVQAASAVEKWSLRADEDTRTDLVESIVNQYLNTILALADQSDPLVLIIEDAHWIDNASAQIISRLSRVLKSKKLLLVLTYRPNLVAGTPLALVRQELSILGAAYPLPLRGFTEPQVREYLAKRYETMALPPHLSPWLTQLSGGSPMFIAHYLSLLEGQSAIRATPSGVVLDYDFEKIGDEWVITGPGRGELPIPGSIREVLNQRIERLEDKERILLELGSVQGLRFMSLVLMKMLPAASADVLRELRRIAEQDRVIQEEAPEQWARRDTEIYSFEHALLRQAFYGQLSRLERLTYHGDVAHALEELLMKLRTEKKSVPRRLLLEIAHHYRLTEDFRRAADYNLQAAESSYMEGAFSEASTLCREILTDLGRLEESLAEDDLLYARTMQILLATSEPQWFARQAAGEEFRLAELIERARAAAQRAGDRHLEARLQYLNGRNLVVVGRLDRAVEELAAARGSMHELGDTFGEVTALIELGHHLIAIDADRSLDTLQEARELFVRGHQELECEVPNRALDRMRYRLEGTIGVGKFDRGDFDGALVELEQAVDGLSRAKMYDLHAIHSNFLAQVLTACGQYERAEHVLQEAIMVSDEKVPHRTVQTAYNLGLLGKLYLEWDRPEAAVDPLQTGWRQIQLFPDNSILPLVGNYYAELLIDPKSPVRDRDAAGTLLDWVVEHSVRYHFQRSVIVAKCLQARLAVMSGQRAQGLDLARAAAESLWQAGLMPAVRAEEVYLTYHDLLVANDNPEEAETWLQRAVDILEAKAASIHDPRKRHDFRERVTTNRSIIDAVARQAHARPTRPPKVRHERTEGAGGIPEDPLPALHS